MDTTATQASRCIMRFVKDLGYSGREVLGEWAAHILLSAWPSTKHRRPERNAPTSRTSPAPHTLLSEAASRERVVRSDSDSDDQLPSASEFIPRRQPISKSAATEVATSGGRAGILPYSKVYARKY